MSCCLIAEMPKPRGKGRELGGQERNKKRLAERAQTTYTKERSNKNQMHADEIAICTYICTNVEYKKNKNVPKMLQRG